MDMPSEKLDGANAHGRSSDRPSGKHAHGHVLTDRDIAILEWIARHGVVNAELVGRQFFWRADRQEWARRATYNRLAALERMRLIKRTRSYGYPTPVLSVTRAGAAEAGVDVAAAPIVHRELRHTLALVRLTQHLATENAGSQLDTERELRVQRYRERNDGTREPGHGRIADALLHIQRFRDGEPYIETVAVELDLSRKDRREIERVIRAYDEENVHRIWWYVTPGRVERMQQVVRDMRAENRIEVRRWLE